MSKELYDKALVFATIAHAGVVRKGTKIPYIYHVVEASLVVRSVLMEQHKSLSDEDYVLMSAAVLHDIVEDTEYDLNYIKENFGEEIAALVASESENKRADIPASETWKIRKTETINHLKEASFGTKLVCLGDKLSNIRALVRDFEELGDECFNKFNNKNKADHSWYYNSIKDELKCFSGTEMYTEFCENISKIF